MPARYAIYYAPDPDSPFAHRAAAWLGRDAATGAHVPQVVPPGYTAADFASLTADARRYGFHATLKAPFALAEGTRQQELIEAVAELAAGQPAFSADIWVHALGSFIAIRLVSRSESMQALHEASVRAIDRFRAPPAPAELARRRKAPLTAMQDQNLQAWGYPYVFADFRFHMTLTGRVENADERLRLLDAAGAHFAEDLGEHHFDALSLFYQPDADSPFTIIERFALQRP